MSSFVGRTAELGRLDQALARVSANIGLPEPGACLLVHGRRRVGKSRLVEQFLERTGTPAVFFTASRRGNEPDRFLDEVARSILPRASTVAGVTPHDWSAALRQLDAVLDDDQTTVVVIDEFPYLVENDESIEAVFQSLWDRRLKKKPVLLILVGSDIAIMEQLNEYGRAFHQRATLFPVGPLTPSETAQIVGTPDASSAFDAYLITGGLPIVCQEWPQGLTMWQYLEEALNDPSSSLVVSAQLSLAAELPATLQARTVLEKIGSGEAAFSTIQKAAGGLDPTSLKRSLETLADKRIVAKDVPLSTKSSREARYRVGDPYLRFWLRFIGPNAERIDRGRADLAMQSIRADFSTWRGKAIEPVVRAALMSGALGPRLPSPAEEIGGWWPRSNSPEIDLVGADRGPVARSIGFAGTVKWRESAPVTQADLTRLAMEATQVPGLTSSTPLVIVSRTPVTAKGAANVFGPDDLIGAW